MDYPVRSQIIEIILLIVITLFILIGCDKGNGGPTNSDNHPPGTPANPFPANHANSVSRLVNFSWTCLDADNDTLTYDVYLGFHPDTLELDSARHTTQVYNPGLLQATKTYFWRILAHDDQEQYTPSPIWTFTTSAGAHFATVSPTGQPYAILIISALINGEPLTYPDEIAIFDGEIAVGAVIVEENQSYPIPITTWRSDPAYNLIGFTDGHPIEFKIWIPVNETVYTANANFIEGNGTFGYGAYSVAELMVVAE